MALQNTSMINHQNSTNIIRLKHLEPLPIWTHDMSKRNKNLKKKNSNNLWENLYIKKLREDVGKPQCHRTQHWQHWLNLQNFSNSFNLSNLVSILCKIFCNANFFFFLTIIALNIICIWPRFFILTDHNFDRDCYYFHSSPLDLSLLRFGSNLITSQSTWSLIGFLLDSCDNRARVTFSNPKFYFPYSNVVIRWLYKGESDVNWSFILSSSSSIFTTKFNNYVFNILKLVRWSSKSVFSSICKSYNYFLTNNLFFKVLTYTNSIIFNKLSQPFLH